MRTDIDLAERTYERALKADPFHLNSLYNFGVFLETFRDDSKRAAEYYDRAVKCDDEHALARQALAGLLERSTPDRAKCLYEESLKLLGDEDSPLLADFVTFLSKQGGDNNMKRAIRMMTRSLKLTIHNRI